MKGDVHSFHMRHRSLICYKRLHSYGGLKLLSVIALVYIGTTKIVLSPILLMVRTSQTTLRENIHIVHKCFHELRGQAGVKIVTTPFGKGISS